MKNDNSEIDFPTEIIQEGKVKILVPKLKVFVKSPSEYAPSKAPVFYNPVMELNRDIAVLALQAYQRGLNHEVSVCEPLTGCGIRGIRYAMEVQGVEQVVLNDISLKAFQLACYNVRINGLSERVTVRNQDANLLLNTYGAPRKRFDVIDIDPFGSPTRYIDSAIRALRNSGLLILTATDMAPLCGVHPKACIRKYAGKPLRTEYCHELAVRILAGSLAMTAAKYDMGIRIVFSYCMDHYARVYAMAKYGARKADAHVRNMGYILHCFKCLHREPAKSLFVTNHSARCSECGSEIDVAGPLWLGKISDEEFCRMMQEEVRRRAFRFGKRINKTLKLIGDEMKAPITYYVIDKLCSVLSLPAPSVRAVVAALKKEGFQASLTHFNSKGIRSNAPIMRIKEVLRQTANVCQ